MQEEEKIKFVSKTTDRKGGFIYKSIENGCVVTRDNEFMITDIVPVSRLQNGMKVSKGIIIDTESEHVTVTNFDTGTRERLHKSLVECEVEQTPIEYNSPCMYVSGEFETPIGKVRADNQPDIIRKALVLPDSIKHGKNSYTFIKSTDTAKIEIGVRTKFFKSFVESVKIIDRVIAEKVIEKKPIMLKAFGSTLSVKMPKVQGMPKQNSVGVEGEQKPGHKYIERRLNPKATTGKNKYIYLYEIGGQAVWKDAEGKEVKYNAEQPAGSIAHNPTYQYGDSVKYNGKERKVLEDSDNFIVLDFDGKAKVINKESVNKLVQAHAKLKKNDEITYKGQQYKIKEKGDRIALLVDSAGKFRFMPLNQGIETVAKREQRQKPKTFSEIYNEYQRKGERVSQDEQKLKDLQDQSTKDGYGKVNDKKYVKYLKIGDTSHAIERRFNPERGNFDVYIDGEYTSFENRDEIPYKIFDVNEKGYKLWNLDKQQFEEYSHEQIDNDFTALVRTEDQWGSRVSPKYKTRIEFQYEDKSPVKQSKRQEAKPLQTPEEKARIQAEYEAKQAKTAEETKQAIESTGYKTGAGIFEAQGFEKQDNPFFYTKQAKIENAPFQITKRYNKDSGNWETEVTGQFKDVEVNGQKHRIIDINGNTISYLDNGQQKEITVKELKAQNGQGIFNRLGGKALTGKPTKIYLPNGEKRNGRFAIVELSDVLASHDEETFQPTAGFPVSDTGGTVNDRDYQNNKSYQAVVQDIAQNYDARGISNDGKASSVPTISKDFVVLSGNNRTMSAKLAQKKHPEKWQEYQNELKTKAEELGFNPEELSQFKNPYFVRIDDDFNGNYSKAEFAKYNDKESKGHSETENSAKMGDILKQNKSAQNILSGLVEDVNTLSDLYTNQSKVNTLKNTLVQSGIVLEHDLPTYFNISGDSINLTDAGKGLVNQLMLGMVFDDKTLNNAKKDGVKELSNNLVGSISTIAKNQSLNKDYTLKDAINEAVNIESGFADKKDKFRNFEEYIAQPSMFSAAPSKESIALNLLAKKGKGYFSQIVNKYNQTAEAEQDGGGMFGDALTKQDIFNGVILNGKNPYTGEPLFTEQEKKTIELGSEKGIVKSLIRFLKSLRTPVSHAGQGNLLLPSKKNPRVKRWQKTGDVEQTNQMSLFGMENTQEKKEPKSEPKPEVKQPTGKPKQLSLFGKPVNLFQETREKLENIVQGINKTYFEHLDEETNKKLSAIKKEYYDTPYQDTKYEFGISDSGKTYGKALEVNKHFKLIEDYLLTALRGLGYQYANSTGGKSGSRYIYKDGASGGTGNSIRIADHPGNDYHKYDISTLEEAEKIIKEIEPKSVVEKREEETKAKAREESNNKKALIGEFMEYLKDKGLIFRELSGTYITPEELKQKYPNATDIKIGDDNQTGRGGRKYSYQYLIPLSDYKGNPMNPSSDPYSIKPQIEYVNWYKENNQPDPTNVFQETKEKLQNIVEEADQKDQGEPERIDKIKEILTDWDLQDKHILIPGGEEGLYFLAINKPELPKELEKTLLDTANELGWDAQYCPDPETHIEDGDVPESWEDNIVVLNLL